MSQNITWEVSFEGDNPFVFTILTVYVIAVVVMGSIGNFMTIYAVVSNRSLRTTPNVLIASLAVADSATTIFTLPLLYSRLQFPEFFYDHEWLCKGSTYLLVPFKTVAINHLEVIAANRYAIIVLSRHHRYNKLWGKVATGAMIAAMWIAAAILTLLPLVGFGEVGFSMKRGTCGYLQRNIFSWWYKTIVFLNVFQSCVIASPLCFLLVLKKIRASKRRVNVCAMQTTARGRGISREELIITKMVMLMFLFFVVSWLPYIGSHFLSAVVDIPVVLSKSLLVFALSSSSFNAVIYATTNTHFRKSFGRWFQFTRSTNVSSVVT